MHLSDRMIPMPRITLALVTVLSLACTPVFADVLEKGFAASENSDFANALEGLDKPKSSTQILECEILFLVNEQGDLQKQNVQQLMQFILNPTAQDLGSDEDKILRMKIEYSDDDFITAAHTFDLLGYEGLYVAMWHTERKRLDWAYYLKSPDEVFFPKDPVWTKHGYCN